MSLPTWSTFLAWTSLQNIANQRNSTHSPFKPFELNFITRWTVHSRAIDGALTIEVNPCATEDNALVTISAPSSHLDLLSVRSCAKHIDCPSARCIPIRNVVRILTLMLLFPVNIRERDLRTLFLLDPTHTGICQLGNWDQFLNVSALQLACDMVIVNPFRNCHGCYTRWTDQRTVNVVLINSLSMKMNYIVNCTKEPLSISFSIIFPILPSYSSLFSTLLDVPSLSPFFFHFCLHFLYPVWSLVLYI